MTTAVEESSALDQPRAIESSAPGLPTVIAPTPLKHAGARVRRQP